VGRQGRLALAVAQRQAHQTDRVHGAAGPLDAERFDNEETADVDQGNWGALASPMFRPVTNNRTGELDRPLDAASVYRNIVVKYGLETGISAEAIGLCFHSLHAFGRDKCPGRRYSPRSRSGWLNANVFHHPPLRAPQGAARGQPDVPGEVLAERLE
jgi:hypothetical protein